MDLVALGGEDPDGRPVDAGEEDPLDAALEEGDPPPARPGVDLLLHVDPGIKLFTYSPALFGIAFPVGAIVGYAVNRDITAAFGVDLNMTLYVTPSPVSFWISPMFGPAVEFHVDPRLAVGINTRFGPVLPSTGGSSFGFVTQLMLAYRM